MVYEMGQKQRYRSNAFFTVRNYVLMQYRDCINNGADQLHSYCAATAQLIYTNCLSFLHMQKDRVSLDSAQLWLANLFIY